MSEELFPCPFCGGKAKLRGGKARFYDTPFWWWIECTQCVASTRGDGDLDVVLQLWNSRVEGKKDVEGEADEPRTLYVEQIDQLIDDAYATGYYAAILERVRITKEERDTYQRLHKEAVTRRDLSRSALELA